MKKILFSINSLIIVSAIVSLSSCSKIDEFGNINQNPNGANQPVPAGLLTQVLTRVGANYVWNDGAGSENNTLNSGLYCQYFSETQYTEASRYARLQEDWDGLYAGNLEDLQNIINFATNAASADQAAAFGGVENQIAVARILKAYIFWFITDCYGDIPYSEALKGNFGINVYDKQQDVYNDLFKELTEAVGQITDAAGPQGDILFDGNMDMWKKFANSIHLMMALRLSEIDAAKGKNEFNAVLGMNGGVLEEGENVEFDYPGGSFPNPMYNYYNVVQRKDYAVSETMTDKLKKLGDTIDLRINAYASSDVGFPYGLTRDDAVAFANGHTDWARVFQGTNTSSTMSLPVLTAGEIYLARAEAAYLGWTNENVENMYSTGIEQSWNYWGVFNDSIIFNKYIASANVALTGSGSDREKIATQEWLAHYPNGVQGWSDWRRTGFPVLDPAPNQPQPIPTRFAYGQNEFSYNPDNVDAASAQYSASDGMNSQFSKIWWDK